MLELLDQIYDVSFFLLLTLLCDVVMLVATGGDGGGDGGGMYYYFGYFYYYYYYYYYYYSSSSAAAACCHVYSHQWTLGRLFNVITSPPLLPRHYHYPDNTEWATLSCYRQREEAERGWGMAGEGTRIG